MNKVYIIFPLIGLLIFGGFYVNFSRQYEAKIAQQKLDAEAVKKAKALQEIHNREIAIQAAIDAQAKRKKERDEAAAIEEAKKVARQEADDGRSRAYEDRNRFRDQVGRLHKDLDLLKETIAKISVEKQHNLEEDTALKVYVKQTESNVKYYYDLLDKIAAAEKAAAEAAAAAAAAAAKKS